MIQLFAPSQATLVKQALLADFSAIRDRTVLSPPCGAEDDLGLKTAQQVLIVCD